MKKTLLFLSLLGYLASAHGGDLTSDTLAIRAILRANGVSDTVRLNNTGFPPRPTYFVQNGRVGSIDLQGMGITVLTKDIQALDSLVDVELSHNDLTALPPEIGTLTRLSVILVDGNRLTSLPPEIGSLSQLAKLSARGNALSGLPSQIGNLKKLKDLDLASNQLTSLPSEIGNLSIADGTIDLGNNKLTTLPASFSNMGGTVPSEIRLNNNQLTSLPASMGSNRFGSIHLTNNFLTSLPEIIDAPNLVIIEANNNLLVSLPDSIYKAPKLQILLLKDNKIAALPKSIMKLASLDEFDIRNSELTDLPWDNNNLPKCCGGTMNVDGNRLCGMDGAKHNLRLWLDFHSTTPNWGLTQRCGTSVQAGLQFRDGFSMVHQSGIVRIEWSGRPFTATVYDTRGNILKSLDGRTGEAVWTTFQEKKGVYFIRVKAKAVSRMNRIVVF